MPLPLGLKALPDLPANVARPAYAREALSPGIVHFGVGNFHRAHMQVYLDRLFNADRDLDWAIVGAGVVLLLLAWAFTLWIALLLVVLMGFFAGIAYLAGFTLLLPLLLLWERRPSSAGEGRPLRLRVISADGREQRIEVARSMDELVDAARRQQLSREHGVELRLHPRAGSPARLPSVG